KGAENVDPILHSFKNAEHVRVGVRDVVGKDDIRSTHAALADIAEACLKQIANREYQKLVDKFGVPLIGRATEEELSNKIVRGYWEQFASRAGAVCQPVVLALGKLGGREPNYHSDLDLIFLFEAGGHTFGRNRLGDRPPAASAEGTTNSHFFSEFGQRLIRICNQLGPFGRLYEVDARLRPTGKSGSPPGPFGAPERHLAQRPGH